MTSIKPAIILRCAHKTTSPNMIFPFTALKIVSSCPKNSTSDITIAAMNKKIYRIYLFIFTEIATK